MSAKWSSQTVPEKASNSNFAELLKDEFAVILLQGKNPFGDMIYCYLKVAMPDVERLQAALHNDDNFNASDFGTVVAAGKGQPPEEVRAEMAVTYKMIETPPLRPPPPPIPTEKKAWDEY